MIVGEDTGATIVVASKAGTRAERRTVEGEKCEDARSCSGSQFESIGFMYT